MRQENIQDLKALLREESGKINLNKISEEIKYLCLTEEEAEEIAEALHLELLFSECERGWKK